MALAQLHNDGLPHDLPHDLLFSLSSFERKIREIDDTYIYVQRGFRSILQLLALPQSRLYGIVAFLHINGRI